MSVMDAITEQEFTDLTQYVKENYGINLSQKKTLVVGRLQNYLAENGYSGFSEYFRHILTDRTGAAGITLINKLTTNHTYFMREPQHFHIFQKELLPYFSKIETGKRDLRIWSAGCSSGEEPYTLALLTDDYFGADKWRWDTKILATDISTAALEKAKSAVYSNSQLESMPGNWRGKYFQKIDSENSTVVGKLRQEVIFRRFNLMNEYFPFKNKFHVIFCRNVMIYFDAETRRELVNRFYQHTEPGGYLFIGHSESLNQLETKYRSVAPAVYRRE